MPESPPRTLALALLPPGEERKGCVRAVHNLGMRLLRADSGLVAFDYSGTGESPGGFETVRWQSLVEDAASALKSVADLAGVPAALLGIRLGARIALEAAGAVPGRDIRFCLWEPVLDSKAWLREARRRSRFRRTAAPPAPEEGVEDIDGIPYGTAFIRDLESLPLPGPDAGGRPCRVIQIGHRSAPSPSMAALAAHLGASEPPVCVRQAAFWLENDVSEADELTACTAGILCGEESNASA